MSTMYETGYEDGYKCLPILHKKNWDYMMGYVDGNGDSEGVSNCRHEWIRLGSSKFNHIDQCRHCHLKCTTRFTTVKDGS